MKVLHTMDGVAKTHEGIAKRWMAYQRLMNVLQNNGWRIKDS
jgi:fructose-specific phosphotransferase system component IIB